LNKFRTKQKYQFIFVTDKLSHDGFTELYGLSQLRRDRKKQSYEFLKLEDGLMQSIAKSIVSCQKAVYMEAHISQD
tara:strand:- start:3568 stop:3795 length:228 start_codon:yes stop_codon:yes gene_type:complete